LLIVSSLITLRCFNPMLPTRPDSNNAPIFLFFN
jgi:hypothetical protein